jgi:GNAT superfamily N-acetyltransferase
VRPDAGDVFVDDAEQVHLLDGTGIFVRRLGSIDVDAVIALHNHLTERERYFRFFVTHLAFLRDFAGELVRSDETHCALGAFDSGRLVGVANYAVSNDPHIAEVAVVVSHEDHLRGVATALLRRLARVALSNGIHGFVADVLTENAPMLKVLSDAGWEHSTHFGGPVLNLRIDLTATGDSDRTNTTTEKRL